MTIKEFVEQFEDFPRWDGRKQVDYLAYFLIAVVGQPSFSAREMAKVRHPLHEAVLTDRPLSL